MIYQKEIPVFFTIDNSYAPFLAAALSSAIKNCSPQRQYKAIILHQELTKENMEKLSLLATGNFSIEFVEMKDGFEGITDRMSNRLRCDYFTLTIYFRLFIATMFPQYDKAIYLDSDVVVPGDISRLYNQELGDNIVGACHDFSIEDIPPLVYYVENAVGIPIKEYVNSGILLMNLKRMRELHFADTFHNLLNTFHFDSIAPDQDYLNAMCHGHILYLDECWDTMPQRGDKAPKTPSLIHYNLFDKPWCYDNIPYQDYFWRYARETEFCAEAEANLKGYTPEQAQRDKESMDTMAKKALSIPDQEVTFKKMVEKGENIRICS